MGVHCRRSCAGRGHDVNPKNFFIDALTSALDLGIATSFDAPEIPAFLRKQAD